MENGYFIRSQFWKAFELSIRNRYLLANIVYVIYTMGMILIDYSNVSTESVNKLYYYFGFLHLFNACMYIWSWEGRYWTDVVMIPEYLNVFGACLYLYSRYLFYISYIQLDVI